VKAKHVPAADLVLLKHYLAALHLPTIQAECEQVARQCASENTDYLGFLLRLCEGELANREQRACARRLKAARFPQVKSPDTFDFTAQPSLNRTLILELSRYEFVERRESVILLGGQGTGEDAHGHWVGGGGLPARQEGALLPGDGAVDPVAGGAGE
jgi:hypothetical protein